MDSLTFYDIYRADQGQLERRVAQLQMVRELRAERAKLAAERGLDPAPPPARGLRRLLRGPSRRPGRPAPTPSARSSATSSSAPVRTA